MNRLIILFILVFSGINLSNAEIPNIVIPLPTHSNYALYDVTTGVFLKLDTRNGKLDAIVPSNSKKNKVLNAESLIPAEESAQEPKPGRFALYPTEVAFQWLLFDSENGNMWILNWTKKKKDILVKIDITNIK